MSKISVIIPVYNAEEYIRRCLDSITNQTLKDLEILCIDDCSSDNSLEILNDYAQNDERIKVYVHKKNGGESKARNTGLNNATGEYIAFVDNDDYIDSDFYEKLYEKAKETDADIVKAEAVEVQYNGFISKHPPDFLKNIKQSKAYFVSDWWTAIYKLDMIRNNKINFPEGYSLGGDILFLNKAVFAANKLETVEGTFYYHIKREDSGDSKFCNIEKIKSCLSIFEQITDNLNNLGISIIGEDGYLFSFYTYLISSLSRSFTNDSDECKILCAKTALNIYNKCIDNCKECLIKKIKNFFPLMAPYIINNDIEGLTKFIMVRNTPEKFFVDIFRSQIRKGLCNGINARN